MSPDRHPTYQDPECPVCRVPMVLVRGGYRPQWLCPNAPACEWGHPCDSRGRPRGRASNREIRHLRRAAHLELDRILGEVDQVYSYLEQHPRARHQQIEHIRDTNRQRIYVWLGYHMGLAPDDAHIACFNDVECEIAIQLLKAATLEGIRRWYKHDRKKLVPRSSRSSTSASRSRSPRRAKSPRSSVA